MSLHPIRWQASLVLGAAAWTIFLLSSAGALPAEAKAAQKKRVQPDESFFTNPQVYQIQIQIPEEGMATLRQYRWRGWNGGQGKRPSVKCTVREDGRVYTNVAVQLKGAAGSFRPVDANPGLTLNFDKHVKGQTFHGLERFSLNNSVQDRSFLNEEIARGMFAAAGVPVPRATHAKVELNGRDLGVYVLTEAFNKQFLARHFSSANGNLYDGGFLTDVTDPLEKSSGPNPEDRSDLKRLADAAMSDPTNRLARLEKVLDLDRFLSLIALDVLTCNWDGYALNKNNYRLYHDPASDRFVFMPHGLDQMFGVMRAGTDMPLFPRMNGLLARAVRETPEGRQRYRERLAQLMTNVFQVEALTNRTRQLAARIRPVLAEKGPQAIYSHEQEVAKLCQRIVERARYVREEFVAPDKTVRFDSAGVARFTDWKPRVESGKPVLDESGEADKKVLHIGANGSCFGVWFTKVRLEPGRYRLEGKMKSRGVTPDPGDRKAGSGLRVSDQSFKQKLMGDNGWTDVAFDFDIRDAASPMGFMEPIRDANPQIELICGLRAAKGEAWFDRDSLRLVRK